MRQDLEIATVEHDGRPMFVLHDREGINGETVALSAGGMAIAALLNGRHTAADLQSLFAKSTGAMVNLAEIQQIVRELERHDLLETPAVQAKRRRILKEFLANPVRKIALKGAYPDKALELAAFMGGFFRDPKGPGKPLPDQPSLAASPIGLIAPHIDLQRGGPAYAWSYGALAESPPPDLIVALGVAHASPNSPWVMTRKAYETPYGPMNVDAELYGEMADALWYDPTDDEWAHRTEHSLEFQALWLKFLWRDKTPSWVPILCSSFERFCRDRPPSTVETVEGAIEKIGALLAKRDKSKNQRILILAGVDLAHVGPRFGDEIALGPETERKVEAEDRKSLEHALALDADAFYMSVVTDGHWRKVCGLSALYTSLRWIKALVPDKPAAGKAPAGKLLTYGQAPDPMGGIVSFAGGIFSNNP